MVRIITHHNKTRFSILAPIALLTVFLFWGTILYAALPAPPLLLSLDVEQDNDVNSLKKLNLNVPATYFVTGAFTDKHQQLVKALATQGTIGSHSYAHLHLTEMGIEEVKEDLLKSAQAIKSAIQQDPKFFRAPFLEVNEEVLAVARVLGFRYDSSESERWVEQSVLSEIPISINSTNRILFSDYNIFMTYGFDEQMALDVLKENYQSRMGTGRPFIFLLHPSIIAEHADVLHEFISYVQELGGPILSFEQYLAEIFTDAPANIGVRIDPSAENIDVQKIIENLAELNISDAFILARDKSGNNIYQKALPQQKVNGENFSRLVLGLHKAGIKVHAWIPVLKNETSIKKYPDQAMVDGSGLASTEWLSPTHPNTLAELKQYIVDLLNKFPLQGIHLDDIAYPGLNFDFSPMALNLLAQDTAIPVSMEKAASELPNRFYKEWMTWRFEQIAEIVKAAELAASQTREDVIISAALGTNSLLNFRDMEISGQDYKLLAENLDMIVTRPADNSIPDDDFSLSKLLTLSHSMIGHQPLMVALPETSNMESNQLSKFLALARNGVNGVIFPSYHDLILLKEQENTHQAESLQQIIKNLRMPTVNEPHNDSVESMFAPEQAQASMNFSDETDAISEVKAENSHGQQGVGTLLFALMSAFALLSLVGYSMRKRKTSPADQTDEAPFVPLDWNAIHEQLQNGELTGQLACSIARYLRTYDPVSTSRFRISFILDTINQSPTPTKINEALNFAPDLPGWHILAMSHIIEAVMHGYLTLNESKLAITPKGLQELRSMKRNGFTSEQWLFVEKRLHEILIATCPRCGSENTTHWYWTNFTCSTCNRDIEFLECSDFCRKDVARVELNQHLLA